MTISKDLKEFGKALGVLVTVTITIALLSICGCAALPKIPYTTEHRVGDLADSWASGGSTIHIGPVLSGITIPADPLKVVTIHNPLSVDANISFSCAGDQFDIGEGRTVFLKAGKETRQFVTLTPQRMVGDACEVLSYDPVLRPMYVR